MKSLLILVTSILTMTLILSGGVLGGNAIAEDGGFCRNVGGSHYIC